MPTPLPTQDITRTVFAVLFIGGLIAGSLWILWPFLPAVIWATMIVVPTWPVLLRVQGWLWGRRWLAVMVMTAVLLLVFVVPLSLAIGTIVTNADVIAGYLGKSEGMDEAVARFADAYADQTDRDYDALVKAAKEKRIRVAKI